MRPAWGAVRLLTAPRAGLLNWLCKSWRVSDSVQGLQKINMQV